jgi:hypothetical protein
MCRGSPTKSRHQQPVKPALRADSVGSAPKSSRQSAARTCLSRVSCLVCAPGCAFGDLWMIKDAHLPPPPSRLAFSPHAAGSVPRSSGGGSGSSSGGSGGGGGGEGRSVVDFVHPFDYFAPGLGPRYVRNGASRVYSPVVLPSHFCSGGMMHAPRSLAHSNTALHPALIALTPHLGRSVARQSV